MSSKTESELEAELILCEKESKSDASMKVKINIMKAELNEKASYLHKTRAYGQGECRIGKSMDFSEDIYSLCYVS